MTILQGIILGLVQGLGEFLPISSSGHLLLTRLIMGVSDADQSFKILDILMHVGTLLPVIILFWHDWWDMVLHPIRNKTLLLLFVACLPTLACYVLFDMDSFDNGWFLGPSFLLTALLLLLTDVVSRRQKQPRAQVGLVNALCMGLLQGLGLLPGVSRSGSTIAGGVFSGLDRKAAAKFSFMMSAPAIAASLLVEGKHALDDGLFQYISVVPTLAGIAVAAISGYFALKFMLDLISRVPMAWFALYVAILGVVVMLLQLSGSPLLPPFHAPEAKDAAMLLHALVG